MPIDTSNSKEIMAGSHITKLHTHKCEEPVPPELLNEVPNVSQACDLAQNYQLDSSNKSKDLNILSKTNNVTPTKGIGLFSQENQDYYNQHNQQFIARKHDGGLQQVTIELVPDIILEGEEDDFYQWAENYDQWDNNPYTPVEGNETGGSHTFNVDNSVFNLTKTEQNRKSKTRIVSEVSTSNNKSDFYIGKRQS